MNTQDKQKTETAQAAETAILPRPRVTAVDRNGAIHDFPGFLELPIGETLLATDFCDERREGKLFPVIAAGALVTRDSVRFYFRRIEAVDPVAPPGCADGGRGHYDPCTCRPTNEALVEAYAEAVRTNERSTVAAYGYLGHLTNATKEDEASAALVARLSSTCPPAATLDLNLDATVQEIRGYFFESALPHPPFASLNDLLNEILDLRSRLSSMGDLERALNAVVGCFGDDAEWWAEQYEYCTTREISSDGMRAEVLFGAKAALSSLKKGA